MISAFHGLAAYHGSGSAAWKQAAAMAILPNTKERKTMHDAHVREYRAKFECPACAIAGGYCGAACNGAHNWFRGPSR